MIAVLFLLENFHFLSHLLFIILAPLLLFVSCFLLQSFSIFISLIAITNKNVIFKQSTTLSSNRGRL